MSTISGMKKPRQSKRKPKRLRSNGYHVFLSHSSSDKWVAKVLCEKLEQISGVKTFRDDRDIKSGDDIPDEIRRKIVASHELVLLLTPDSVNRPWVLLEAGAFWGRRINARIIAVLCHVALDTIPDMIKTKKAISINDFDDYVKELAGRIRVRQP